MENKIAITGVALQVGELMRLEDYWQLIKNGGNTFGYLSEQRREDIFSRFGEFEVALGSYLDRIDLFDNDFFGIYITQAERMDPEQRMMLQTAVKAVYNSGSSIASLKGQRIGVFYTARESRYKEFFDLPSTDATNHHSGMIGARIANFMDWRGPVIGISTACSSSLAALHYAVNSIKNGECDRALVGGVLFAVYPKTSEPQSPNAKNGQCVPYDADPGDGIPGEGAFCLMLTKADIAVGNGDPIYALLAGSAITHSGRRAQDIHTPSPEALTDVMEMAWRNAAISAEKIGFIEGIGIGTELGDTIEIGATYDALAKNKRAEAPCYISSGKGQIGGLTIISGIAGVIRAILAIKNKALLSQPGLKNVNAHINNDNGYLKVSETMQYWHSDGPRIAGVTSHGLTGTSVHVVLEEYLSPEKTRSQSDSYLFRIAGTKKDLVAKIKAYLINYLSKNDIDLQALSHSLNRIIEFHNYGYAFLASNCNDLIKKLASTQLDINRRQLNKPKLVIVISGLVDLESLQYFCQQLSGRYHIEDAVKTNLIKGDHDELRFLFQYFILKTLIENGVSAESILGGLQGKELANLLSGRISIQEALERSGGDNHLNSVALLSYLNSLENSDEYLFWIIGEKNEMSQLIGDWTRNRHSKLIDVENKNDWGLEVSARLYNYGFDLDFNHLFKNDCFLQELDLPVFEEIRFWPRLPTKAK